MVNDGANRVIPKRYDALLALYRKCQKSIIRRLNNKRSVRSVAGNLGVSHPIVMRIRKDPNYIPSRKTMVKIVQKIMKPKTVGEKVMITIKGDLLSTKNHQVIAKNKYSGKRFVIKNKPAKKQEDSLGWQLLAQKKEWQKMLGLGRMYPLRIRFRIYRKNESRWDYINIIQGLADAMIRVGFLPDDDAKHFLPVFDKYEIDELNPRTEIEILN